VRVFLVALLACAGCGPQLYASNNTKVGEALAFAAVAGAAQVAQAAMEQQARNNAPMTHASYGFTVSPNCTNDGQYGCMTLAAAAGANDPTEPEMSDDDARDYVLGYVNGVRKLNGAGLCVRDEALDSFAQAGSDQLARDHSPNAHIAQHARELRVAVGEVQGPPEGSGTGALQDQLGALLLRFTGEGTGGTHHDIMLRPEWRRLGVGITHEDGHTFFTADFSP
jgi:uncharacterized protein YkwD